jgi:ferric uptake regulator, fur family
MNYSRQREIILETLQANVVHPTAEYLYAVLKAKAPNISLATLYRNLNQLADNGVIKKIDGLEAPSHYDHNTHVHYHFICDECKRVFDVSSDVAPDIVRKTEEETGFIVKKHDIIFNGICRDCLEKIKESN